MPSDLIGGSGNDSVVDSSRIVYLLPHLMCYKLFHSCIGSCSSAIQAFPAVKTILISPRIGRTSPGPPPEVVGLDQNSQELELVFLGFEEPDRIIPVEAGHAEALVPVGDGLEHLLDGEVAERVGGDVFADLIHGVG